MSMFYIKKDESTAARRRVPVYLVDATDGYTPETGVAAPTVEVSKNGAAQSAGAGSWAEIGDGNYYYEFTAGEVDTLGWVELRVAKAGTSREYNCVAHITAYDAYASSNLGLSNLDAAVTTRATPAQVNTEVDTALADARLDEFISATAGGVDPTIGSIADQMMNKNGSQTFDPTTDSLEAIKDSIGGGSTDWSAAEREQIRDALGVDGTKTAATGGQLQVIDGNVDDIETNMATQSNLNTKIPTALSFTGSYVNAQAKAIDAGAITSSQAPNLDAAISTRASQSSLDAKISTNLTYTSGYVDSQVRGFDANVITAAAINTGAITAGKFAAGAIDAAAIGTGAIDADAIAANAITDTKINAGAITSAKFASGAITSTVIAAGAITSSQAPNLDAAISTRAPLSTALSNATWTDAKAGYLTGNVALDSTVAKEATINTKIPTNLSFTGANVNAESKVTAPPSDMALNSTVAKDATVAKDSTVAKDATVSKAAGVKGTDAIYDDVVTHPTLAEILAGGVALDSTVAKSATALSNATWTDAKAGYLTGNVALDSTVSKAAGAKGTDAIYDDIITHPTLAEIEASTVIAKQAQLVKALGLAQENQYIDQIVYTLGKVTSMRLRTYDSKANVGTVNGVIATYTITADYTGDVLNYFKAVLE